jgi:hypothetical protein
VQRNELWIPTALGPRASLQKRDFYDEAVAVTRTTYWHLWGHGIDQGGGRRGAYASRCEGARAFVFCNDRRPRSATPTSPSRQNLQRDAGDSATTSGVVVVELA